MPRNVEIKARLHDPAVVRDRALGLCDRPLQVILQTDTFFRTNRGRLKLRDFRNGTGELIFYDRPDLPGPKTSRYRISPTDDPEGLRAVLAAAYPVATEVRKTRTLLMAGRTRIHLDEVEDLGSFLELEVVLADQESEVEGQGEARRLLAKLGIDAGDLITGAYADMLADARAEA